MTQRQRPCNPKKQLYEGQPGAMLVCPDCHQTMEGIRYDYGIGLLTLPIHYDPHWIKSRFQNPRIGRTLPPPVDWQLEPGDFGRRPRQ